jgi:hypothetical protein
MHIFKSRNPLWLLGDIAITVWLWSIPLFIPAIFFSLDTLLQLVYTFFPELVDTFEKSLLYRIMYVALWLAAVGMIVLHLSQRGII